MQRTMAVHQSKYVLLFTFTLLSSLATFGISWGWHKSSNVSPTISGGSYPSTSFATPLLTYRKIPRDDKMNVRSPRFSMRSSGLAASLPCVRQDLRDRLVSGMRPLWVD